MEFYAKTYYENGKKKGETLQEHTECLLSSLNELKKIYSQEINKRVHNEKFWDDLKIACLLHDLGKIATPFQNKIRSTLDLPRLPEKIKYNEIPHNYISPSFMTGIDELGKKENEERRYIVLLAIAFHHERPLDFDKITLERCLSEEILCLNKYIIDFLKTYYDNYNEYRPKAFYYDSLKNYIDGNNDKINELKKDKNFILLKGFLHRLDYAASAHVPVETSRLGDTTKSLIDYLNKEFNTNSLKPFQKRAYEYRDENIILTASTGIGKTEFAINWLGDSKGFYTLPLRVSSNAMHERLTKIFDKDKVGLLHSDSFSYLIENNEELSIEANFNKINISRQLSFPLTVATADQLFTSVFKWPGYERIYATLAYSKVILDEPQGYSPKTLAMIIRCLEDITALGSKFCYMSATNHPFIIKRLQHLAKTLPHEFCREHKHKLEIINNSIDSLLERIIFEFKSGKKVLVISNTVKKSQQLYKDLTNKVDNLKLLHSGFIRLHRNKKETEIQKDFKNSKPVVWISTQIVEASLDIDYDVLFTEAATLDSLVQRMGRIYRKAGRIINKNDSPNIIISITEPSDKYNIYNKTIIQRTIDAIIQFNNNILTDEEKQMLMDQVYNEEEIKNTKFYNEFISAYQLLDYGFQTDSKNKAQQLFREISQINGIPITVYEQNDKLIDELIKKIKSKKFHIEERLKAHHFLNQFTLSIPVWKKTGSVELEISKDKLKSIFLIPGKYDNEIGLIANEVENIF